MADSLGISEEYFISFDTRINPGKIVAVRVRIDQVTITDLGKSMAVNFVEHPLYSDLVKYVDANRG